MLCACTQSICVSIHLPTLSQLLERNAHLGGVAYILISRSASAASPTFLPRVAVQWSLDLCGVMSRSVLNSATAAGRGISPRLPLSLAAKCPKKETLCTLLEDFGFTFW